MWCWMAVALANPVLLSGDRPPADLVDAAQSRQGAVQVCLANDTSDVVLDVTVKANGKVSKLKGRGGTKSAQKCVISELAGLELPPREEPTTMQWTLTTRYLEDISYIGDLGLVGAKGTSSGPNPSRPMKRATPSSLAPSPGATWMASSTRSGPGYKNAWMPEGSIFPTCTERRS